MMTEPNRTTSGTAEPVPAVDTPMGHEIVALLNGMAQTAVETTDVPAVTTETTDTETAVETAPEPIAVGTLLTRQRTGEDVPVMAVITSLNDYYAYGRDASGYRHTVTLSGIDTAAHMWKRTETMGSGVSAILASLAVQVTGAESRLEMARREASQEMEAFRDKVKDVAMRYAADNDWCAVVARALGELDISVSRSVTVSGTFSVNMELPYGEDEPSQSDVLEALESYDIDVDSVEDSE